MPSKRTDILDSAERRIRSFGYTGFSFRDVASDVGIKSASVHHHFPTKGDLAAEVAHRYSDRFFEEVQSAETVTQWATAFRTALSQDGQLCLCGVLAANRDALPEGVALEARAFFETAIEALSKITGDVESATRTLSTLEGAMILARSMGDLSVYDTATKDLR